MRLNLSSKALSFFVILVLYTFLISCKSSTNSPKEQSNVWEYRDYVSQFTNGVVSKLTPIEIKFSKEVDRFQPGEDLPKNLMQITPNVKGKLSLVNAYTLLFEPVSPLKSDQEYSVSIRMDKLFKEAKNKKPLKFQFRTIQPNYSVLVDEFQKDPNQDEDYILLGHIETADVASPEEVERILTATQNGRNLPIHFDQTEAASYFNYMVSGIRRYNTKSEVNLSWSGKSLGVNNKGSEVFEVPDENTMSVVKMSVIDQPDQVVKINFSDQLVQNQDFNGLVEVQDADKLRFSVNGNILWVYPDKNLIGSKQVDIHEGIKSTDGSTTKNQFENVVFGALKPEVRYVKSGTILPNSNGLKLNFETVSLRAVDVRIVKIYQDNILQFLQVNNLDGQSEVRRVGRPVAYKRLVLDHSADNNQWRAYSIDLEPLIDQDQGAIYQVELSFRPEYSTYNCGTDLEELEEETVLFPDDSDYWDNVSYYDSFWDWEGDYQYSWRDREDPCKSSYYRASKSITTNVLASDIGIIAKGEENHHQKVYVTNLITAKPQQGAEVSFYNFQLKPLRTSMSNPDGFVEYTGDEKVSFITANYNNQISYLKVTDENALITSQFAVDGYQSQDGLRGYIYGERGIWRPGDLMYINFVLNDQDNPIPEDHPIKFRLKDPEGQLVDEQITNKGLNKVYSFTTQTMQGGKTGNYLAEIAVGGAVFYKSLPVETIKPNRLKIQFEEDGKQAHIQSKWLHGGIAKDLKVTVDATLQSEVTHFDKFPSYIFDDPVRKFSSEEKRLYEGKLNAAGKASFPLNFGDEIEAPGKLKVSFVTKVYEKGGSFSIDAFSEDYSPYSSYVGLLMPKVDNYFQQLDTDKAYSFSVATVDDKGNPIARKNVEVAIYKVDFRWWWNNSDENFASYVSGKRHKPVFETTINTDNNGMGSFNFQVDYPSWGRYLVRVKDPVSGHYSGSTVYFDYPYWRGRSPKDNQDAANIISVVSDKEDYQVGDIMEVSFPSSANGRALVSIENGTRVLDAYWVDPTEEFTKVKIKATQEMAPNIYVTITYIQPHSQTENDLPIRLYGILPLSVYDAKTQLHPVINMPDELKPNADYKITVKEENGQPMTYTLAIVDEGLLDLTRFNTPNPWDEFYQKQALGVHTWDLYDEVIGAYGGRIDQIFTIGGGALAEAAGAKKAQRFKPIVTVLGPFELASGASRTHELNMPNYVGSVRAMVVASDVKEKAFGKADKTVPVRTPLMVLGTVPRKVSPGERIKIPISVFSMKSAIKSVNVSFSTNDNLLLIGNNATTLTFEQEGEKEVFFEVEAPKNEGIAKIEVLAKGGGQQATWQAELDVVNPNSYEVAITTNDLEPNAQLTMPINRIGDSDSFKASLQLSTLPDMNFDGRLDYLIQYPHGCAEQVTSKALPQLYVNDIVDLNKEDQTQSASNVKEAIQLLRDYQSSNGGFVYWPGSHYNDDYVTSYVGQFLVEAKNKGYAIPFGMLENWTQYQQSASRGANRSTPFNQAYRLYTLALAGSPDRSGMNRLKEQSNLSTATRYRLAAAYAIIGQEQQAKQLINRLKDDVQEVDYGQIYGSSLRNEAMALETAILLKNDKMAEELAKSVARQLAKANWYSTQTTAYSLLALSKFIEQNGGKGVDAVITINNKSIPITSNKSIVITELPLSQDAVQQLAVQNNKANKLFASLVRNGKPLIGEEHSASRQLSLGITYSDLEGNKIKPNNLPQATEFIAHITVKNLSNESLQNMALTYAIPSGWEIINTRFAGVDKTANSAADYIDIQDDRLSYYFDLSRNNEVRFNVLLNASFLGNYYLPGALVEAMYDNQYYAKKSGEWIEVVAQ